MAWLGLIAGLVIGLVFGSVFDAHATWIAWGCALGWSIGSMKDWRRLREETEAALDQLKSSIRGAQEEAGRRREQMEKRLLAMEARLAEVQADRPDRPPYAPKHVVPPEAPAPQDESAMAEALSKAAPTQPPVASEPPLAPAEAAPVAKPAPPDASWVPPRQPASDTAPEATVAADRHRESSALPPPAHRAAPVVPPARPRPSQPMPSKPPECAPPGPTPVERAFRAAKDWLMGGNTVAKVGSVLVFLGLAFLLRYVSEKVVVPLELRYAGVALAAFAALALGWRLRSRRRAYGLLMQGMSVAVMYLTTFSALRLHQDPLLPAGLAFAILVAVAALSAILAVTQDALVLAVAGAAGGFAAPVLASSGGGSMVGLFSYLALLDAGILAIAWFKAWRPLNLVGFFGTFAIGLAWGLRSYDPALHYPVMQGFLVLFFLAFVCISLLFVRRLLLDDPAAPRTRNQEDWFRWLAQQGGRANRHLDATLLFGVPVAGFGVQCTMMADSEYGSAFSALALGFFYLVLAKLTHARNAAGLRLLVEVFLALGLIFASLAIPLGLSAQWTSAAWAVEAAGIYWVSHRQARPLYRAFAVLLQACALVAWVRTLGPGTEALLSGSWLGAALLGLALLANAFILRAAGRPAAETATPPAPQWDGRLGPVFSTVGLWCLYLVAPILFAARGASMALALAGLATAVLALKFRMKGWLSNAFIAQMVAAVLLSSTLASGTGTLISGPEFAAALLGAALLASMCLRRRLAAESEPPDGGIPHSRLQCTILGLAGLWSLYLVAALYFRHAGTAMAWALAGLLTMMLGLRFGLRSWIANALVVQLAAGAVFLLDTSSGSACGARGVLAAGGDGWRGLLVASLVGLAAIASVAIALREARRRKDPAFERRMAWFMLFGLSFLCLAVLFALPWAAATAVWAGSGLLVLFFALRLSLAPAFWFALFLELAAGASFLLTVFPHLSFRVANSAPEPAAFGHSGFWAPVVMALAVFSMGWRLQASSLRDADEGSPVTAGSARILAQFSLLWAVGWWGLAWWAEIFRLCRPELARHLLLLVAAVTALPMSWIARRWSWPGLVAAASLPLPFAVHAMIKDYSADRHPFGEWGALACGLMLASHLLLIRAARILGPGSRQALHVAGIWTVLLVLSMECRHLFLWLSEAESSWRWLGWTLPLCAWLMLSSRRAAPAWWPAREEPLLYRDGATLPVAAVLLVWVFLSALGSAGTAAPLPFLPLLNPLELAQVLVLVAAGLWLRRPEGREESLLLPAGGVQALRIILCALGFLVYTAMVARGNHHYAGVPFRFDDLRGSMSVQASLSIAWSLCALGLMIAGNRLRQRPVWIAGAVLVAVVVAKLFLVELSSRGSLERIISFLGVGVLLLVVGYFAPLPPGRAGTSEEKPS